MIKVCAAAASLGLLLAWGAPPSVHAADAPVPRVTKKAKKTVVRHARPLRLCCRMVVRPVHVYPRRYVRYRYVRPYYVYYRPRPYYVYYRPYWRYRYVRPYYYGYHRPYWRHGFYRPHRFGHYRPHYGHRYHRPHRYAYHRPFYRSYRR